MSEQNTQPDLIDRELIPARAKVSFSRDIGEAVVTENIFGKARVRIIRPGDKLRRVLWTSAFIAAAVVAFVVWQVWLAAQQIDVAPEVAPSPAAVNTAPAEAVSAVAEVPAVQPAPVVPHVVSTPQQSSIPPTQPTAAVVPPRPVVAPRPPLVQPQSAVPGTVTQDTAAVPPRVLPRRLPPKPAASAPVAAATLSAPASAPVAAPQTSQAENEANKP
jgi:hypothetical protein